MIMLCLVCFKLYSTVFSVGMDFLRCDKFDYQRIGNGNLIYKAIKLPTPATMMSVCYESCVVRRDEIRLGGM